MTATATRLVIVLVGTGFLLTIVLIGILSAREQPIPDVLQNIAVGSLTLLGGILVKPAREPGEGPE